MKSYRDGEWWVTTPFYAGSAADLERAMKCPHETWAQDQPSLQAGHVVIAERCEDCVATRLRYKKEDS